MKPDVGRLDVITGAETLVAIRIYSDRYMVTFLDLCF